jgi:uncharacterized protein
MLTTPDATDGDRALNPGGAYPQWQQTIAARSVIPLALYRPARTASRISCPLLAVISTRDQTALAGPALRAAHLAPAGEVLQVDGTHYAAFLDQHETVVAAELDFLGRHLLQNDPVPPQSEHPPRGLMMTESTAVRGPAERRV